MNQPTDQPADPAPAKDLIVHAARVAEKHDLDPMDVLRTLVDLALIRRGLAQAQRTCRTAAAWN
jgi:hypothetical protein